MTKFRKGSKFFYFFYLTNGRTYTIIRVLLFADVAQEVEHFIGNEEVGGSTPLVSSIKNCPEA